MTLTSINCDVNMMMTDRPAVGEEKHRVTAARLRQTAHAVGLQNYTILWFSHRRLELALYHRPRCTRSVRTRFRSHCAVSDFDRPVSFLRRETLQRTKTSRISSTANALLSTMSLCEALRPTRQLLYSGVCRIVCCYLHNISQNLSVVDPRTFDIDEGRHG